MFDRSYLVAPLAAFLLGVCALWTVRRVALAVGFVDHPDQWRKLQKAPIALGGGIAVWLATWSGWGLSRLGGAVQTGAAAGGGSNNDRFAIALAIASFVVLGLGVIDDRYGMRVRHKVAGQVLAAIVLVCLGLPIDAWSAFGVVVNLGLFAYPVAICWIVLVVNAFNLVDGMDGFCGSLGLVAALATAFLAFQSGRVGDAILGLALAGALAAFLGVNLPPARVYLGDAGSMTLGLMIAALTLRACSDGPNAAVSLPPLVALLSLPLLDVVTAIGRRSMSGYAIFAPDCGHIHHCLKRRLGNIVPSLAAGVGLALLGAIGAMLAKVSGLGDLAACLAVAISAGVLVGTNTFGRSELGLLLSRMRMARARTPLLTGGRVDGPVTSGVAASSTASGTGVTVG